MKSNVGKGGVGVVDSAGKPSGKGELWGNAKRTLERNDKQHLTVPQLQGDSSSQNAFPLACSPEQFFKIQNHIKSGVSYLEPIQTVPVLTAQSTPTLQFFSLAAFITSINDKICNGQKDRECLWPRVLYFWIQNPGAKIQNLEGQSQCCFKRICTL